MTVREKERQSNFELLRIMAMLMIIVLHFFSERIDFLGTANTRVYYGFDSIAICGVNVFVLLTGYFSLNQNHIKLRKNVDLLIDVVFWSFLSFLLCVFFGWRNFDLKDLIKTLFPIIFGGRWFVKAYIILLCFIPFINIVLTTIGKQSYQILLGILVLLFSIWPFFLPNPPFDDFGYSFVHFIMLYTIAGYLRLHVIKFPPKWICFIGVLLSFTAILVSKVMGNDYTWAYDYLFVVLEALFLLMLFAQISFKSHLINKLAATAFGVLLLHTSAFFNIFGYEKFFMRVKCSRVIPLLYQ